jgi:DNA-binding response OmpR family regulator
MSSHVILIVEDDAAISKMVATILGRDGYSWIAASDGAQAIRLLGGDRICLVLLDLMMPRVSGFEVLEHIREQALSVPVVVMTAAVNAISDEHLDPRIVKAVVTKPFSLDALRKTIEGFAETCPRHRLRNDESVA